MTWQDLYLILATGSWIWIVFAFAFGACVGSLTNVLVYRLPLGISVVTPPSRCPACQTKLTWKENFPVFGWLRLRGRCRFCGSPISPEYPLVEAFVGALFAMLFVLWYTVPQDAVVLGVNWGAIKPDWAAWDARSYHWPRESWPMFITLLVLAASLVAMSLVDLKTYTIPLQIPWFATVVGLLFHAGYAAYLSILGGGITIDTPDAHIAWALPTPAARTGLATSGSWWWVGASIGGLFGLLLANLALHFGLIRRSFADYADWEATHAGHKGEGPSAGASTGGGEAACSPSPVADEWPAWIPRFRRFAFVALAVLIACTIAGSISSVHLGVPRWMGLLVGALAAPLVAAIAIRPRTAPEVWPDQTPADEWILYPHARREMLKELVFLTPCIGLAWLGGSLATNLAGTPAGFAIMPLWLNVLTGVLMGYLIGGGVVWAARLFGSLAFGKEAMGLGDVHLMAAVGACAGWIDATLAFPLAALVGLYWVVVHVLANRQMPRAMQFGPYLAMATMLVILGKPLIELGLTRLLVSEAPINLP
ncbi:MAG: prepilin peptidase [Phycisphaerales bacterium]|nr:prepilin peptidase [Phycisphaerales bacterium]